jgi:hypothetical protein
LHRHDVEHKVITVNGLSHEHELSWIPVIQQK